MPYFLAIFFVILSCNSLQAESRNSIVNNSATGSMSAVAGKGGVAVSGGVVISKDGIIKNNIPDEKQEDVKNIIPDFFSSVFLENISGSVSVFAGNKKEKSIFISSSSSVQSSLDYYIDKGVLKIFFKNDVSTNIPVDIKIKAGELKGVFSKGSADIYVEEINGDFFEIKISGTSSVSAGGNVDNLKIIADGSGEFNLSNLKARRCNIIINGSGDAVLNVTESLSAQINGSGDIIYYGNPQNVSRRVNGSGDIRPAI